MVLYFLISKHNEIRINMASVADLLLCNFFEKNTLHISTVDYFYILCNMENTPIGSV
jgi:hypothetical protein